MKRTLALFASTLLLAAAALAAPPANDNFANAKPLTGRSGHIVVDTTDATEEAGEYPFGPTGVATVWFRVSVPAGKTVILDTFGSDFDTFLEAGPAPSLGEFSNYYDNNDAAGTAQSRLAVRSFEALGSETFYVRARGALGEVGTLHLNYLLFDGAIFSLNTYWGNSAREGGVAEIGVIRSGNLKVAASVQVALQDDSATAGEDYLGMPVTVYFAKDEVFKTARVPIYSDGVNEGPETVLIQLVSPSANAILGDYYASGSLRIDDADDDPANDNFTDAEVLNGLDGSVAGDLTGAGIESGEESADIGMHGLPGSHTVWYCWTPGASGLAELIVSGGGGQYFLGAGTGASLSTLTSALADLDDYDGLSSRSRIFLNATAGETYWIMVAGGDYTGPFTFEYKLFGGGALELIPDQTFREDAGTVTVTVRRVGGDEGSVSVDYETRPPFGFASDADPATDYTATNGTLTFADGVTERTFTIALTPDTDVEGTEIIHVRLTNATGGASILTAGRYIYVEEVEDDPANDVFANATAITGSEGSIVGDNTGAGSEAIDPRDGRESVWYSWVVPTTGFARFRAAGDYGNYGGFIQIRAGTSIVDSVVLPVGGFEPGFLPVTAGQTLHIAVHTLSGDGSTGGPFTLSWETSTHNLFHFSTDIYTASETDGSATVRIERDGPTTKAASVFLQTTSDSFAPRYAAPGDDFKDTRLKVTFAAGQAFKDVSIPIYIDNEAEGTEGFGVVLNDPSPGNVTSGVAYAGIQILDSSDYAPQKATFSGLVTGGALGQSGYFTATTDAKGMLTGKLLLGGKAFSFKGAIAADGTAHITIPRKGTPPPTPLVLDLQFGDALDTLAGTLVVDGATLAVSAHRSTYTKADPAPFAGRYTAVFDADGTPGAPDAPGYAIFSVAPITGAVKMTGALADGTKFSWGTFLAPDGTVPVSVLLYKLAGILQGELQLGDYTPEQDGSGALHWIHPAQTKGPFQAAFVSDLAVRISAYQFTKGTRALGLADPGDAQIDFSATGTGLLFSKNIRIDNKSAVTVIAPSTNAEKVTVKIATATGLISGSFKHTDGKVVPYTGVLYQRTLTGAGFFLGPTVSGAVEIEE